MGNTLVLWKNWSNPPLSKGGNLSPPFGLRPRAVSDPEGKGRLGGILQDDFKQLNWYKNPNFLPVAGRRNKSKIQLSKFKTFICLEHFYFEHLNLFRISCFGFRFFAHILPWKIESILTESYRLVKDLQLWNWPNTSFRMAVFLLKRECLMAILFCRLYPAFPNLYLHSEPVCIGCQVFS